jgi:hypothetical protein
MVPVLWDVGTEVSRNDPYAASPELAQMMKNLTPVPAAPPPAAAPATEASAPAAPTPASPANETPAAATSAPASAPAPAK